MFQEEQVANTFFCQSQLNARDEKGSRESICTSISNVVHRCKHAALEFIWIGHGVVVPHVKENVKVRFSLRVFVPKERKVNCGHVVSTRPPCDADAQRKPLANA